MINLRQAFDPRNPWFSIPAALTAVMTLVVIPWAWPGKPYRYDVTAHRASHDGARVLVTGDLHIIRPCPGATTTTWFEGPDHAPEPAVRTGHLEHDMVGKSTVVMVLDQRQTAPLAMEFQPPEWATGIRWLLRLKPECDGADRGLIEVGYVEIPKP